VTTGRGMHVLGFVPLNGLRQLRLRPVGAPTEPDHDADEKANETATMVRGPASWKKGRPVYEYGNYGSYYGYRNAGESRDLRLAALASQLGEEVFKGLEVLDIGCNTGLVSLEVARCFGARRVVGVDIDAELIEAAKKHHQAERAGASAAASAGATVSFRAEDVLSSPLRRPPSMEPERFDAILCFSVTKWLHFAHGDDGIRKLFRRCRRRLRPGGLLVLEPQDWSSYKKKRHLTREIRQTVAGIHLRPEGFSAIVVEELGFERVCVIAPPADATKGFKRTIFVFRKPDACPQQDEDAEAEGFAEAEEAEAEPEAEAATEMAEAATMVAGAAPQKKRRRDSGHQEDNGEGAGAVEAQVAPRQKKAKKARTLDGAAEGGG